MLTCAVVCWRMLNVWWVPAVFTRVSSSSQWILSAASNLSRHPDHFTLDLNITQLSLPGSICSKCILLRESERLHMYFMESEREGEWKSVCERELCIPEHSPCTPPHRNALSHALVEKASETRTLTYTVGRSWTSNAYYPDVCWRMPMYADVCWVFLVL
jgi:hypothetical protein